MLKKRSIVNSIMIIFIALTLVSAAFMIFVFSKETNRTVDSLFKENMTKLVEEKSDVLRLVLQNIENETRNMGYAIERLYDEEISQENIQKFKEAYEKDNRGILSRIDRSDKTSLFVSGDTNIDERIIKEIIITEELDSLYERIYEDVPEITCVYTTSKTFAGITGKRIPKSWRNTDNKG